MNKVQWSITPNPSNSIMHFTTWKWFARSNCYQCSFYFLFILFLFSFNCLHFARFISLNSYGAIWDDIRSSCLKNLPTGNTSTPQWLCGCYSSYSLASDCIKYNVIRCRTEWLLLPDEANSNQLWQTIYGGHGRRNVEKSFIKQQCFIFHMQSISLPDKIKSCFFLFVAVLPPYIFLSRFYWPFSESFPTRAK